MYLSDKSSMSLLNMLSFLYHLNFRNTVVIIPLMSLLTNSNICVNSGSVLIKYSSIMSHNFLLLCIPDNFLLDARLYEFYLDGC